MTAPPQVPFVKALDFAYGRVEQVSPLIRRVIANNPSPFTFYGTGTYIVGHGEVAVIDPGPLLDDHVAALQSAVAGERISHILVTHTHLDHSPAAAPLGAQSGAPTYGFGPHGSGRPELEVKVEEGADRTFTPDRILRDGQTVTGPGWTLEAVHTPGHTSNHLCYALREERALFSGDHVMGWSTTVISPPDGDMGAYMTSLERLLARDETIYWPTHGPAITAPRTHVEALIDHRRWRTALITAALADGAREIPDLVARIYVGLPPALRPAAGRTVLAHLIHLVETGQATCQGPPEADSRYFAKQ